MSGNDVYQEKTIVDAIYQGACEPAALQHAVELMAQYFSSGGAFLGEFDPAAPESRFVTGAGTIDHAFLADYEPYALLDPAPRTFASLTRGTVSTTDRLFSAEFLRTNAFLNEFLIPHGINATLGGPLFSEGGRFAMVAVHQAASGRRFEDEDVARLERFTPHLTRALQIRRLVLKSEIRSQALEWVVNRSQTGMIGLRGDGPALFVNDAARLIASACDGIGLDRQGRPLLADRTAARRLAALEADVARGGSGGLLRIQRPSGRPPYQMLVSPLPTGDKIFPGMRGGVLIALHDPSRDLAATADSLAYLLRLPKGAANVVKALLDGSDLKDYAEQCGISIHTVRFHLKTAFARTGAHSQAELVRTALSALADLGSYVAE
jgi:hypothetical protein